MSTTILGIRIDDLTVEEALMKVESLVLSGGQHLIFTPNPEMLVKAHSDSSFKEVLNQGNINLCDGIGMMFAGWLHGYSLPRITGVDFMIDMCARSAIDGRSIYLLGSGNIEVVSRARENLLKKFPNLNIVGIDKGPEVDESGSAKQELNNETLAKINAAGPDILFVAFGMGKQEKWLVENLSKMPCVKIGMGVGGAFDYLSESVPRAPRLMRKIGLEWLYRLWKQPRRIGRIFNATIKFSYLILTETL